MAAKKFEFFIRVLKTHAKKNKEAAKAISQYERGLITCRDCLLMIANTMTN